MNTSSDEVRDVYLASLSTYSCHDVCLIDYDGSFHMTPLGSANVSMKVKMEVMSF